MSCCGKCVKKIDTNKNTEKYTVMRVLENLVADIEDGSLDRMNCADLVEFTSFKIARDLIDDGEVL